MSARRANASEAPDRERFFEVGRIAEGLRDQSIRAGRASLVSQVLKIGLRLGSMMILARLLVPEDFGLVAMVASLIGVADLFKEFGLATVTIQREHITHQQVSNLFWINTGIGVAAAFLIATAAPLIARFYDEPRLTAIAVWLSSNALLGAMAIQHQAILRRQLRFTALALVDVISLLAGIAVGLVLAVAGASYWALIGMALATTVTTLAMSWLTSGWLPSRPRRAVGTGNLVRFGRDLFLSSVLGYVSRNLDNVLVGWRWGSAELGYYSRAYQLFMLPLNQIVGPISNIALPALSRLQADPVRFVRYYRKILSIINAVTLPVAMVLAVFCNELVRLVLGPGWEQAVPILLFLSVAGLTQPVMSFCGVLYTATGRSLDGLKWSALSTLVFCAAFGVGLPFGAVGVAAAYSVSRFSILFPAVWFATRNTSVTVSSVFSTTVKPLVAGACSVAVGYAAHAPVSQAVGPSLGVVLCAGGAWILAMLLQLLFDREGELRDVLRRGGSLSIREP